MADLAITATLVVAGANARKVDGVCGETITAGQAVYYDAAAGRYLKADANSAVAAARVATGIALNGGAINQPLKVQTDGLITIGAALTAGMAYALSSTAGAIRPVADNTTGDYPCLMGIATTTAILDIGIQSAGVAL